MGHDPDTLSGAVLDGAVIDRLRGDFDPAVRRRLLDLFLGQAPALVDSLRCHLAIGDDDGVAAGAHRLKGSCLNLGARRMSELCARLERLGPEGDPAVAGELVDDLDRALVATTAELRSRLVEP